MTSNRDLIRKAAYELLAASTEPLHFKVIAERILPSLDLANSATAKLVNDALHEDPRYRFKRVGRGTWRLRQVGEL